MGSPFSGGRLTSHMQPRQDERLNADLIQNGFLVLVGTANFKMSNRCVCRSLKSIRFAAFRISEMDDYVRGFFDNSRR